MISKDSVKCVACSQNEVEYALDCLCTLCFKCFASFGKTILAARFEDPSVVEFECFVCKKTTKGGNKSLQHLSNYEKMLFICNMKLVNGSMDYKRSVLMETAKEVNQLNEEVKELTTKLEAEKGNRKYLESLLVYLRDRYKITIDDIEPIFYFNDPKNLLYNIFPFETKLESTPVKQMDKVFVTGSDTKKKTNANESKENYNGVNLFNYNKQICSSKHFKDIMRESSRSVPSQNNSKKKGVREDTPMVKVLSLAEGFGNKTDELPFSFAVTQNKPVSKGNSELLLKKIDYPLFEGSKVTKNMFRSEKDVNRCLESDFKNISDIKNKSEKDCHQSLESLENHALLQDKEAEQRALFFLN